MTFNPNFNANIYSPNGMQVGHYNAYTGMVTLNNGVQNPHNPYLSVGPGMYNVNTFNGSINTGNPMSPNGIINPNGTLFPR